MSDLPSRERGGGGYERLVEAVGDGVYALDADGRYVDVNEELVEMSGYDEAELLDSGPALLHDRADINRFEATIGNLLASDERTGTVEAILRTADGEEVPIEVTITLLTAGDDEFLGHVGVVREVSHRKEREQELEAYETMVRAMPDEVYTLDESGHFTSVVPPAGSETTTSGYDPEELLGEHVTMVMDEEDVETGREVIRDLLESDDREKASFEMEVITKDGERIPHENHVALLTAEDGETFRGSVGVLRDISERKERERTLERQNERLEEFANVVSHDLRNPLTIAGGHLELLQEDHEDDRLDRVANAHERMSTIVEDVLALAREGEHVESPESLSLRAVARDAWTTVDSKAATIGTTDECAVEADEDRLRRLLENLFRNAIEHGGDDVTVTLGPLERAADDRDGFFVADDGPGIPADECDDIFESGYSAAPDGTGLGLAIVRRIADAHGWDVDVTESRSGGARFEFTGVTPG